MRQAEELEFHGIRARFRRIPHHSLCARKFSIMVASDFGDKVRRFAGPGGFEF
jgi:hypothetical protein